MPTKPKFSGGEPSEQHPHRPSKPQVTDAEVPAATNEGKIKNPDEPPSGVKHPVNGDGIAAGCQRPGRFMVDAPLIDARDVGLVIPSWVQAYPMRPGRNGEPPEPVGEFPRTLRGQLASSHTSREDFPPKPWHTSYDWCFNVVPDSDCRDLLSVANIYAGHGQIECEWEEAHLPAWARPWGDRSKVWVVGRWIYDCGHPIKKNGRWVYRTEIHPPKLVATSVPGATRLPGNDSPTPTTELLLYVGAKGGYFDSAINDSNYELFFELPPKPERSGREIDVQARWTVRAMTDYPVKKPPVVRYVGGRNMHVVLDLQHAMEKRTLWPTNRSFEVPVTEYGIIISAGWSDPDGAQARSVVRRRVTLKRLEMLKDKDGNRLSGGSRGEWHLRLGVNGTWWSLDGISKSRDLDMAVDLHLGVQDQIELSISGFEADSAHDALGDEIGVTQADVGKPVTDPDHVKNVAGKIARLMVFHGNPNDLFEHVLVRHAATVRAGTYSAREANGVYQVTYTIT